MTTSGIDSAGLPAKLLSVVLRVGRFCGAKKLTFLFGVGSWNELTFCHASTPVVYLRFPITSS